MIMIMTEQKLARRGSRNRSRAGVFSDSDSTSAQHRERLRKVLDSWSDVAIDVAPSIRIHFEFTSLHQVDLQLHFDVDDHVARGHGLLAGWSTYVYERERERRTIIWRHSDPERSRSVLKLIDIMSLQFSFEFRSIANGKFSIEPLGRREY